MPDTGGLLGYGLCAARPEAERVGRHTSDTNECRIAKFAQAPDEVVAQRYDLIES